MVHGDLFLDQDGRLIIAEPNELAVILGSSPAIEKVRERVLIAAERDMNVLLTGETGTGKGLVARSIHRLSARRGRPLNAQNCALVSARFFKSQFFGHCQETSTGARETYVGLLEEADGSDLFLDVLETLPLECQTSLVRVMDQGEAQPVGSASVRRVSVRFIAATNRDPELLVAQGKLRKDFLDRLRGFEIHLPPLREHAEDIPLLVELLLRDGGKPASVSEGAMAALLSHEWPGNVRELRNVVLSAQEWARFRNERTITRRHLELSAFEE